jgi:uncharacterized membrane protein
MRIDLARLLLIDLIIAVPGGLLAWTISRNSAARRMVARILFYSIVVLVVAPSAAAMVWGGTVLIENVQREVANQIKRFRSQIPATIRKKALAFDQATLRQARDAGYNDDEIYSYLAAADSRFRKAQQNGYSLDEIAAHPDILDYLQSHRKRE